MRNRVSVFGGYSLVTIREKVSTIPAWKNWRTAFARMPGVALVLLACLAILPGRASAAAFDDFESYAVGSNLIGQGGWAGWAGNPSAGALVSGNFSFSPTRSVNITGASDLVHTFTGATNGLWVFSVMQYIPSTSTGDTAIILMNTYRSPYGTNDLNWSVQIQCDMTNAQIISDFGGGATLHMITDQWVEFRFEINLSSNSVSEFYNGQFLTNHLWQGDVGGPGLNEIQALDLFANNAAPVYYDNVTFTPPLPPTITCPADITTNTCSVVAVNYPNPTVVNGTLKSCTPPSGSLFPPGTTPVYCVATNSYGDTTNCSFTVTLVCDICCSSSTWADFVVTNHPAGRSEHAMAYDATGGTVVLFGGYDDNNSQFGDTWLWDGAEWEQVFPAHSPSARYGHEMAYDEARHVVVLFGGISGSTVQSDTWEWDGTLNGGNGDWTLRTAVASPGPRARHSMAYDPINGRVMLFGGQDGSGLLRGDSWEWTGSTWVLVAPNGSGPSARHWTAMATDLGRNKIVLFGGDDENGAGTSLGDTWEWNGSAWNQITVTGPAPSARHQAALAFSPGCASVLLFGGWNGHIGRFDDTWLWDGTSWNQRISIVHPSARQHLKLATDAQNATVVMFGGFDGTTNRNDTWGWGCHCSEIEAVVDENGNPIFPSGVDPNSIEYEEINRRLGTVEELYPQWDTTVDLWYTNLNCLQSIGGTVPTNATNPDFIGALAEIGITNVLPEEISLTVSNWEQQISEKAMMETINLSSAPAIGGPYSPPAKPHCTDPTQKYVFGGRDIIFVHGLKLDHIRDKILNVSGARETWRVPTQFPASADNPWFYDGGYFKTIAECTWKAHIKKFLIDKGFKNRYLIVAYPSTERLEVGVQAVLTQISDAMRFGTGVVDLSGNQDTSNFGTPSFVVLSHSTGSQLTDVAMASARLHQNLGADHIWRLCKAHIAMSGTFSGSRMATAAVAFSGYISLPTTTTLCPLVQWGLLELHEKFPCSPLGTFQWDCGGIFNIVSTSILVDTVPLVAQLKWGPYVRQTPVPTLTLVGGHPSAGKPLKFLLQPGFDDSGNTINSQVANPNSTLFWPSGFFPGGLFPLIKTYDMGVAGTGNLPASGLDSPHRAIGYYIDQVVDLRRFLTVPLLIAGGATPYLSPSGMRQNVGYDYAGTPFSTLARYPKHFSFIQSASDHFKGYNGAFGGFNGQFYKDTEGDDYLEHNLEESRVITDSAVYSRYSMLYPDDDAPLLTPNCVPHNETWERGRVVRFKIFKKPYKWWIWRRLYDLLEGWESKMGVDYMYDSVLCSPANPCPTCIPPPSDLALWLPFDEVAGSDAHNLASGFNGVLYNGAAIASAGSGPTHIDDYSDRGLCFDGIDDGVDVPSYNGINASRNNFTLDAWVKRDPNSGTVVRIIADKRRQTITGQYGYSLSVSFGNLILTLADGTASDNYRDTAIVPTDGLWHFVAVTVNRSSAQGVRFYLDGKPTGVLNPTAHPGSLDNTAPFRVGRAEIGGNQPWMGCIDEVEFFRRALQPSEILSLYRAKWAGKCKFGSSVPPASTICLNDNTITVVARICNYSITRQVFSYSFQSCPSGPHPAFNPASGTILVQAGQCATIPVVITRPAGGVDFCYQMLANAQGSHDVHVATGLVQALDAICDRWVWPDPHSVASLNQTTLLSGMGITNTSSTTRTINYRWEVWDQFGVPDSTHVSLNQLAPGIPVTGSVTLPPGGGTNLSVTAAFVEPDPFGLYNVVLLGDLVGDGTWTSLSSYSLQNVNVPAENPPLVITASGTNIVVSWNASGTCHVQSATTLSGSATIWTDISGLPPVTVPITATSQFFRLVCP